MNEYGKSEIESLREVISFLLGEGPLAGIRFGEENQFRDPIYFWRRELRNRFATLEASLSEPTEEMCDRAAREGYAVRCKTNGPRTLEQYAGPAIMKEEHENARVVLRAGLAVIIKKESVE